MKNENLNFYQNKLIFLNELLNIKSTNNSYLLKYNNLIEEQEIDDVVEYIITYTQQSVESQLLSNFIKNKNDLIIFDKLLDEILIKQVNSIKKNKQLFNNDIHFKYIERYKNNFSLFFKLLHVKKFFDKFEKQQSKLLTQSNKKQILFFKTSINLITLLLKKFVITSLKSELKFNKIKSYGIVTAIIPFKGIIIYSGSQRFFLPMSKISIRQINKKLHLEQCLLLNGYLMYNTIKFIFYNSNKKFYRKKYKQNNIQLIDYKKTN